jgi:DNA-binding response OmpR family regulator
MDTNAKPGAVGQRPGAGALGLGLDRDFAPGSMLPAPPATVLCGDLKLDRAERRALLAGTELHLTKRECALLLCLADHTNRVMRRSDLLAQVWMLPDDDASNLVAVYIRRLRQKLGAHASMITTIRGVGYRLRPALDG